MWTGPSAGASIACASSSTNGGTHRPYRTAQRPARAAARTAPSARPWPEVAARGAVASSVVSRSGPAMRSLPVAVHEVPHPQFEVRPLHRRVPDVVEHLEVDRLERNLLR